MLQNQSAYLVWKTSGALYEGKYLRLRSLYQRLNDKRSKSDRCSYQTSESVFNLIFTFRHYTLLIIRGMCLITQWRISGILYMGVTSSDVIVQHSWSLLPKKPVQSPCVFTFKRVLPRVLDGYRRRLSNE